MTEFEYNTALDRIEAAMGRAYLDQVRSLVRAANVAEITRLIEAGDLAGLTQYFDAATYGGLTEQARAGYLAGAAQEAADLPGRVVRALPGAAGAAINPAGIVAATWIAQNAANIQQGIAQGQREALQQVVQAGLARGDAPRTITISVIGLEGRTGARTGGVIGLTGADAQYAQNAMDQLLSGDKAAMRQYLTRELRDRRLDGIVKRAIAAGTPVARDDADKIVQRYTTKLLSARAEMVAQTEALGAYNAGRQAFYQSLIAQGIPASAITKRWKTKGDGRVRDSHRVMQGQMRAGTDAFISGRGAAMMNPGDMTLGATLADVARCRCRAVYGVAPNA